jgi:hypothetical protein
MRFRDLLGPALVPALDLGEPCEELPDRKVGRALRCVIVKIGGLALHQLGLATHLVEVEARVPPGGAPAQEAAHVLAPDRREVFAETLAIEIVERIAVAALFLCHVVEDGSRSFVIGP